LMQPLLLVLLLLTLLLLLAPLRLMLLLTQSRKLLKLPLLLLPKSRSNPSSLHKKTTARWFFYVCLCLAHQAPWQRQAAWVPLVGYFKSSAKILIMRLAFSDAS
jgi:hypothetical protein